MAILLVFFVLHLGGCGHRHSFRRAAGERANLLLAA
jgi:hypothetical protein